MGGRGNSGTRLAARPSTLIINLFQFVADLRKKNGGKRSGSGRKSKAEEMGLVSLLDECWTLAQRKECVKKLAQLASVGDMDAIKLLMAYTFGKPKESVDVNQRSEMRLTVQYGNDGSNGTDNSTA
jgi:hypothetical protein